jgi:hypothetical protein
MNKEHILVSPKYCVEQNKKKSLTENKPYDIRQRKHVSAVDCRRQSITPKPYIV